MGLLSRLSFSAVPTASATLSTAGCIGAGKNEAKRKSSLERSPLQGGVNNLGHMLTIFLMLASQTGRDSPHGQLAIVLQKTEVHPGGIGSKAYEGDGVQGGAQGSAAAHSQENEDARQMLHPHESILENMASTTAKRRSSIN